MTTRLPAVYMHDLRRLHHYFFATWLLLMLQCAGFLSLQSGLDARAGGFTLAVWLTYPLLYLMLPVLFLLVLARMFKNHWSSTLAQLIGLLAALAGSALSVALLTDFFIYKLFEFHLNGFVWNLLTTPGGITSMGADDTALMMFAALMLVLLALHICLWQVLTRDTKLARWCDAMLSGRYQQMIYLALALTLVERIAYAHAAATAHVPTLRAANVFPFYMPTTATHFLKKFGVEVVRKTEFKLDANAALNYPKAPLQFVDNKEQAPNIVWLVAESWRADSLNAKVMPLTQAFAEKAWNFRQHFSGGNGTRWGIFTQFYGLYGTYWFSILENRRAPVLVDRLQALNYQMHISTSSAFSYPEFDKTVWVNVPSEQMHLPSGEGPGWRFDRQAVDRVGPFLDTRDTSRPFFMFHFFESAHARYYFPDESVIVKPYLADLNYATMDVNKDIELIRNRYINSAHHLDSQLGRVISELEQRQLLDNTIIVITGDHGEEFMEKGHWGHNSQFTVEQTQVPMLLYVPGQTPKVYADLSSHLDLPATILTQLGAVNPPRDYSFGCNLLSADCTRTELIWGDWDRVAYADKTHKLVFPLKSSGYTQNAVTDFNDTPLADEEAIKQQYQPTLIRLMKEMSEFSRKQ